MRSWQADIGLLMVSLVWGVTFVLVKDAIAGIGPLPFIFYRFALGTACLLPFVLAGRGAGRGAGRAAGPGLPAGAAPGRHPTLVAAGFLIGLVMWSGFVFQTVGLQFTTPSKAAFITGMSVVIVPFISRRVARAAPPPAAWAGVALAAVGMALLTLRGSLLPSFGDLLVFVCAGSFALHIALVGRFTSSFASAQLALAQTVTVAALSGGLAAALAFTAGPIRGLVAAVSPADGEAAGAGLGALRALLPLPLTPAVWTALLFTGVLATAGTTLVQTAMQRHTSPTHTGLIFATEPVFAAMFSFLLAGEVLGARALAGGALIVAGMVLAELMPDRRPASPAMK